MSNEPAPKKAKVASPQEWLKARKDLLTEEKALSRARMAVAEKRQDMPWLKLEQDYEFINEKGETVKMADLFLPGKDTLLVYHMMFDDTSNTTGCFMCASWIDGFNGVLPHLLPRTNVVAVGKAGHEKLNVLKATKKWDVNLFSSKGSSFNHDMGVEFSAEERKSGEKLYNQGCMPWPWCEQAPGLSVFHKSSDGTIYKTYDAFGPGLADVHLIFSVLDLIPSGRDEKGPGKSNMWWVKHKEDYGKAE
mmetsp:Transcript_37162/g.72998  ORF Transcript_37162/g.72998 Transcript_37162/m.72998 type:complete len:248 (-) Transcript_37162:305-1048(-)|eukprot:CAMPEP_0175171768 /NCGR_PEP_ID=MMETSP0087-20121206/31036_1 /TAXON_ID=136419 /ORGANISM="Unknown Unknown, Strain D1" /LENGTH=247 /DNA_ID=CAMNT_0016462715 /DNA_START=30 /DNA_END=773 /DNA_ORIENTATION=-